MPASIRTLSQLPEITSIELNDKSRFEVSLPVDVSVGPGNEVLHKFASKSIAAGAVSEKIRGDMRQDLIDQNGLTKEIRVDGLCSIVSSIAYSDFTFDGEKNFVKDPKIDNSPLSGYPLSDETLNGYSVNYETLKRFTNVNSSPTIGPNFGFVTRLSGFQSGSTETERLLPIFKPKQKNGEWQFSPEPYFLFNANTKNVFPNEYVFKIKRGERSSDSWKAPASGIFTCYGWLDEINNPSQSNESRWVALMGKQSQLQEWTILQVQPFIRSNYLSYVGFTFPVKKGMELKVVTGFAVGSNSDKYFASNSSIANHIGNAFLGGVYTGLSAWNESGESYATGEISNDYLTSADLSDLWEHEASCDLSVKGLIDDLSSKLSNNVGDGLSGLSAELSNRVRYIDASRYRGNQKEATDLRSFMLYLGNGQTFTANEMPDPYGNCKAGVFSNIVYQHGWNPDMDPHPADGNWYDTKKKVLSIDWNDWRAGGLAQIRTYEPLHTSYDSSTDTTTYHELDYTLGDLSGGTIFSEGKYLYYVVSQDCTVLIRLRAEWSNSSDVLQCWLLYQTDSGYNKARVMNIGAINEVFSGQESQHPLTLPLKKGNVIMFGLYKRLGFTSSEIANFTVNQNIDYRCGLWAPYTKANNMETDWLKNVVELDDYRKMTNTYANISIPTIRLNVSFSNWNEIFYVGNNNPSERRYNLSGRAFADIVDILELP